MKRDQKVAEKGTERKLLKSVSLCTLNELSLCLRINNLFLFQLLKSSREYPAIICAKRVFREKIKLQ